MKIKINQNGFTGLEVVLAVLLLVAIGGVGYFALHSRQEAQVATKSSNRDAIADKQLAKVVSFDTKAADELVKKFYSQYLSTAPTERRDVVKMYSTVDFFTIYTSPRSYDPILCGQQDTPEEDLVYNKVEEALDHSSASVRMDIPGNAKDVVVTVIRDASALKIESINCPNLN